MFSKGSRIIHTRNLEESLLIPVCMDDYYFCLVNLQSFYSSKRKLDLQRRTTLPCLRTCWFVWAWHHLGTKAWPIRVWISPATGIGSRTDVWPSWTNETQRWNFYWNYVERDVLYMLHLWGVSPEPLGPFLPPHGKILLVNVATTKLIEPGSGK